MSLLSKYRDIVKSLWPEGKAWNRETDSLFHVLNEGLSEELARVDARVTNLLNEADPATAFESLDDWEAVVGIPDDCEGQSATVAERRAAIIRRLRYRGSLTEQFLIDVAGLLGYEITVIETFPFRMGKNRMGYPMYGANWKFWFKVNLQDFETGVFRMGTNRMGDRLVSFQNTTLECVLRRAAGAHTQILFTFGE